MKHEPLKIAAFFDDRPGHVKQTQGVLDALASLAPVSVTEVPISMPGLGRQVLQWAGWLLFPGAKPGKCSRPDWTPDLIIGTGTHTHIPMLQYKAVCCAPVITCMTPSSLLIKSMDLCIVPAHDNPEPADNIFITLGPPNTAGKKGFHDPEKGLILIGGIDEKSHKWISRDILDKARAVIKKHPQVHWTVSSSFRTPQDMIPELEELNHEANASFYEAGKTGPGWIEDRYGESDLCWVTADSVSMIYEALSAGCRVGVIPVEWKNSGGKIAGGLSRLIEEEMVLPYDDWINGIKEHGERRVLDEAGRAAREILRRWAPDRLP